MDNFKLPKLSPSEYSDMLMQCMREKELILEGVTDLITAPRALREVFAEQNYNPAFGTILLNIALGIIGANKADPDTVERILGSLSIAYRKQYEARQQKNATPKGVETVSAEERFLRGIRGPQKATTEQPATKHKNPGGDPSWFANVEVKGRPN